MQTMNGTQTLAHIHINVHWHLQTKSGVHVLAHIQAEQGMGWGGTFTDACKPRMAHKHWHTYTLTLQTKHGTHALAHIHAEQGPYLELQTTNNWSCKRQKLDV